MTGKDLIVILNLFSSRPQHPLGDAKEVKRVIAELPLDNAFKAADEIYGWFESLRHVEGFRTDHLFDVVRQLDDAAQFHIRRLTRDYLNSPRLSRSEERRLWSMGFNYWGEVSSLYAVCVDRYRRNPKEKGNDALRAQLPLALARLLAARAIQIKWVGYRYGVIGEDLWRGLGLPYLAAVEEGVAQKPVQLYPAQQGLSTVSQLYLQAIVLAASATDSLMPLEIELADRLIAHLLPGFVFSESCQPDSTYWIDVASGSAPVRLVGQPEKLGASLPGLRFFSRGSAPQGLGELIRQVERGEMPKELSLGSDYSPKVVLPVLRHLAGNWSPQPPQREHPRHPVKTRISVLQGFDDCFTLFSGDVARLGKERTAESWVVEDVSLGGFRARVEVLSAWLKIGALMCLQPEGGENWVLGVVRRFSQEAEGHAHVGIKALSRQARSVELRPRSSGFSATGAIPGICLLEGDESGEIRLAMPLGSFDVRESLEFIDGGKRYLLSPIELETSGSNYEIGRYRQSAE